MTYVTVSTDIDVDVDISEFDTDDLLEELKNRSSTFEFYGENTKEYLGKIYQLRRQGKPYEAELDKLIYDVLGKII
jgi:hypothetical protein